MYTYNENAMTMDEAQLRVKVLADNFEALYENQRLGKLSLADAEMLEFMKIEIQLVQAAALVKLARRQ